MNDAIDETFVRPGADAPEAERLRAARAEIEARRRARASARADALEPRTGVAASVGGASERAVARPAPTRAVRPRAVRAAPPRPRRRRALLAVGALGGAAALFLLGRATAPERTVAVAAPAGNEAPLRTRIAELEAETTALQRELLRLELDAAASAPSGDDADVAVREAPAAEDEAPDGPDVPADDTVENRTYGAEAGPPDPG